MGIFLSKDRCEEIKETVVNMFDFYGINCLPIKGIDLAKKMGISTISYSTFTEGRKIYAYKFSDDGFVIDKEEYKSYIFYDDTKVYGRINYTILHEIGHIVLGHLQESELAEKEANFFAKYALVSPVFIHKLQLDNPIDIANKFYVSYEEANYAYSYYQKWLKFSSPFYEDYEIKLLKLFNFNVA